MRSRVLTLLALALLSAAVASPVASVERLSNFQTVLAVAMPDDFPVASLIAGDVREPDPHRAT